MAVMSEVEWRENNENLLNGLKKLNMMWQTFYSVLRLWQPRTYHEEGPRPSINHCTDQ